MTKSIASKSWNCRGWSGWKDHNGSPEQGTNLAKVLQLIRAQQGLGPVPCLPASGSSTAPQHTHCQKVGAEQPRPWILCSRGPTLAMLLLSGQRVVGPLGCVFQVPGTPKVPSPKGPKSLPLVHPEIYQNPT